MVESKQPTSDQAGPGESGERWPRAYLARVPFPADGWVSGVLVPRSMGFLAVRLVVDGHPVVGVEVTFCERDDAGEQGEAVGKPISSDADGIARLPRVVPTDTYLCQVAGQEETAVVHTVDELQDAFDLPLPIGVESVE